MRKLLSILPAILLCLMVGCAEPYDDTAIREDIEDLQERVTALEEMCREMNSNISAMQAIVNALQNNDYITSVTPVTEGGKTIGYTITFAKGSPITIYHGTDGKDGQDGENGKDGQDGQDGADGKDGYTPQIGVKKDTDNIYYWTLDGEWLLDENGNKIKAQGTDGKDGENGADGNDGANGNDGATGPQGPQGDKGDQGETGPQGPQGEQGITPMLKIEDDYWYVSYDNGQSWTQLGKATGEKGEQGEQGPQGDKGDKGDVGLVGDSMFADVDCSNDEYVIFTLSNGTSIQVPTWYAFEQLRTLCNQMNSNIEALQTIVAALQNNDYVTRVEPVLDNGATIGYTIYFSKSNPVTIYHGKDGENGKDGQDGADGKDGYTPQIGVKKDTDNIYYWTLDGEWLLDENGNKIKAQGTDGQDGEDGADGNDGTNGNDGATGPQGPQGEQGITPLLKIEDDYWYVSYDNGQSWTQLGKATGEKGEQGEQGPQGETGAQGPQGESGANGDSFFQSVTQDEQNVYFTLADGTVITLPKGAALDITFAESDLVVMSPNSTREIDYTVTSVTDKVTVEVTSSADIRAKVVTSDASGKTGKIKITTGATLDEYSKVIVFVSNGEKVTMKSITFEQAGLEISNNAVQNISAEGGNIYLNFLTNMDWEVVIPSAAKSWVSLYVPQTRAMVEQSTTLTIQPNTTLYTRSANVTIRTTDGKLSVVYTINQGIFDSITATTLENAGWKAGDALSVFAGNTKNQKFNYNGTASALGGEFVASTTVAGAPTQMSAHYAVFPYSTSHSLGANGKITTTFPSEQTYVASGFKRDYNTMVAVSSGLQDTELSLHPVCAYVCIKLWGDDQTVKSVTLSSNGGEALSGKGVITPGNAPTCVMTGTTTSIALNCSEVTVGTTESTATEFWFVVPAVALSEGYTIKVAGFYGGEQTFEQPATTFVAGKTYNASGEMTLSSDGPGMGVGGWEDGGENGGSAE